MAKLDLSDIANILTAAVVIDANNTAIEQAFENTLSRDGTAPNEMNAVLDMNNNRIINLPEPQSDGEPLRRGDFAPVFEGLENLDEAVEEATEAAEDATEALEEFQTLYLGPKTVLPSTDNQGNALLVGAFVYLTDQVDPADEGLYVWDGVGWNSVASTVTIASQAEAEAGVNNTNVMSPLRTVQSIDVNAENAEFNPSGTGAVVRTLQSKLRERVDARDFGYAPGASASTNRVAFQAAVNSISTGGIVKLPPGTAALDVATAPINTPSGNGLYIEGTDYSTRLMLNSATADGIVFNDWYQGIIGVMFDTSVSRTAGAYVRVANTVSHFKAEDINMDKPSNGFDIPRAGSTYRFKRIKMSNIVASTGTGFRIGVLGSGTGVFDIEMEDIACGGAGSGALSPFAGIYVVCHGDLKLSGGQFIYCGNDIFLNPQDVGDEVASFWAVNSHFDTAESGIRMAAVNNGRIVRAKFVECWTAGHIAQGALLQTASGGLIDGVDFVAHDAYANGAEGIYIVDSGVKNVKVIGGSFSQNADSGIKLGSGADGGVIIKGNRLGPVGNFGANGASIAFMGSNNNMIVTGNDCRGNAGFNVPSASSTIVIANNINL